MGAEAQRVEHLRLDVAGLPVEARGEHRVVGAVRRIGAGGELGRERRVPPGQLVLAQHLRQRQVGVRIVDADGLEHLEGDQARGVDRAGRWVRTRNPAPVGQRSDACTSDGRRRRCRARPRAGHADRVDVLGVAFTTPSPLRTGCLGKPDPARPVGRGHLLLAEGLDLTEPDRKGAGADEHVVPCTATSPGRGGSRVGRSDRADLDALSAERRPGAGRGVHARIRRSIAIAGSVQSIRASSTRIFGRRRRPPRLGPGVQRAVLDPVEGRDQQPAPPSASRSSRSPDESSGRIRSVITPKSVRRPSP